MSLFERWLTLWVALCILAGLLLIFAVGIAAAFGYLIDSVGILLLSGYESPGFIALPIAVSEIAFPLWLLIKGVNLEGWQKRNADLPKER